MTDEAPVAELVTRVRAGCASSGRALVERLLPLVLRIVRSHRPRRVSEEDLAQEVFMKLFSRLDQYEGRGQVPFEHWVSRLAVRTCLDILRFENRRPEWRLADLSDAERDWVEYLTCDASSEAPACDAQQTREIVHKLLDLLSPEDRLVIHLLDLEEKSVAEIAALTGWSAGAVKVRAFRARGKLRTHASELMKGGKL